MTTLLTVAAAVVAVVAAARSTWSPCGVSMLATVTPLAERGRGHRYRTTAALVHRRRDRGRSVAPVSPWPPLPWAWRAAAPTTTTLAVTACAAAALAAASDSRVGGFRLPFHSLGGQRALARSVPPEWVLGAGFGWQIGAGLVTYIKTAALYLMIVLAALTAGPATALGIGLLFSSPAGWPSCSGGGSPVPPVSPSSIAASPEPAPWCSVS